MDCDIQHSSFERFCALRTRTFYYSYSVAVQKKELRHGCVKPFLETCSVYFIFYLARHTQLPEGPLFSKEIVGTDYV